MFLFVSGRWPVCLANATRKVVYGGEDYRVFVRSLGWSVGNCRAFSAIMFPGETLEKKHKDLEATRQARLQKAEEDRKKAATAVAADSKELAKA